MSEIIIESGVTSTGIVAESSDTITILAGGTLVDGTVKDGGIVNGTFGAVAENLKTEAGATVNLETATGSGLMLKGNNTDIAEGTLYWNGNLVNGATVGGVLSGVSSTDPWRFRVGDGIVVSDALLTSGTRIYVDGAAVISKTTIVESGNIGLSDEHSIGREITVGSAGVATGKATLQIRGTTYDTVVSEGGRANVYNTASGTDVYAGGYLEVKDGGSAFDAEIHGGSMGVSSGGYASGANVSNGAIAVVIAGGTAGGVNVSNGGSMTVSNGGVGQAVRIHDGGAFTLTGDTAVMRDFTVEEGGKFIVSGGNGSGATVSGATVTPLGGNSGYALIDQATVYDFNVENGETANSMTVKRATWTGGTVRGGSNTTDRLWVDLNYYDTLNNVTFTTDATESATGICLVSAGANGGIYLNDVTVKNFAYLEYARGSANNLSILDGGFMHLRAIAAVSGLTISGMRNGIQAAATMNTSTNRVVGAVVGSGGKFTVSTGAVSGATVRSGGEFVMLGDTAVVSDFKVEEGGKFYISGTAASGATVSGATVTPLGGSSAYAYLDKATLYDFNVVNGSTANSMTLQRTTWTGGTVRGGSNTTDRLYVNLNYTMALNNVTFTTDAVESDYRVCLVSAGGNGNIALNDVTLENFAYMEYARGTARNLKVLDGAKVYMRASAAISGAVISGVRGGIGAVVSVTSNNNLTDILVGSGGQLVVSSGKAENVLVNKGGALDVKATGSATLAWLPDAAWSGSVVSNVGATVTQLERDKGVYYGGTAEGLIAKADTMNDLEVDGVKTVYVYDGGTVNGASFVGNGAYLYASGGVVENLNATNAARIYTSNTGMVSNAVFTSRGYLLVYGGTVSGATFLSGGTMYYYTTAGSCSDLLIGNGGIVTLGVASAKVSDVTIQAGGSMNVAVYAAANAISGTFTMDLNGGANLTNFYLQRRLAGITAASKIVIADEGAKAGDVYNLVSSADQNADCNFNFQLSGGIYAMSINATVIDPFNNLSWKDIRSNNQIKLTVTAAGHTIAAVDTAAALATSGSTLNGSDREARWTSDTIYGSAVYAAEGMTAGNAWLEIDGANVDKALYGAAADQNFTGAVNLKLASGSIRNLAAGAAAGGSVKAVNFTMTGGTLAGAAYAGGFGNVTEAIKTTITAGTLAEGKDFYAGALANYAKTTTATSVGDISLTIDDGTFGGNIYGASAVKASVAAAHTAGNVTLSITGGETTKGDQACIFAGGYATGSAADVTVYTVGDIDATISGGSWGEAGNGRGVFGGAFASGVTAKAGDVTITIDGGTMGNVFGGGWAQKGGTSIVGDVEITITGGTVANVFGGGTHSKNAPGGATTANDVTINVTGGSITGAIYAGGQGAGDDVIGDEISVNFTGDTNFACSVYGYSYGGGTIGGAALSFSAYTGTFSGAIGGFVGITLDDDTAMTLGTAAADVSNGKWTFDTAERGTALAGTAFLNWTAADFTGDTIKLNLADGNASAWSLVNAAADTAYGTFDLQIGGVDVATGLELDQAIAAGDYAGWGFTVEENVLKFKNLA